MRENEGNETINAQRVWRSLERRKSVEEGRREERQRRHRWWIEQIEGKIWRVRLRLRAFDRTNPRRWRPNNWPSPNAICWISRGTKVDGIIIVVTKRWGSLIWVSFFEEEQEEERRREKDHYVGRSKRTESPGAQRYGRSWDFELALHFSAIELLIQLCAWERERGRERGKEKEKEKRRKHTG